MGTPKLHYSKHLRQQIVPTPPKEDPPILKPIFKTCDVCGHDESNEPWPNPDICPRCYPEAQEQEPPRKRRPVPIAALPTKDRLLLQALLQLSAEHILRFHPSEQVGWLNYLLEQLDVAHLAKYHRYTHANYVLQALRREITDRLETGRW